MSHREKKAFVLDPGLTMIALRAIRTPGGHYPFTRGVRRDRTRRVGRGIARLIGLPLRRHNRAERSASTE